MKHADDVRRLRVRANADTPEDAARARRFGAEGIGLCRTEHMFLGERRQLVENLIVAEDEAGQEAALSALLPLQRDDFRGILEAMDGLPVTIRLIDPPLHEFLPDYTELSVKVALEDDHDDIDEHDQKLLEAVKRLHEQNPMLGLRGVRLGIVDPRPVHDAGPRDPRGRGRPDRRGRRPAARDHDPAGGARSPSSTWSAGQVAEVAAVDRARSAGTPYPTRSAR